MKGSVLEEIDEFRIAALAHLKPSSLYVNCHIDTIARKENRSLGLIIIMKNT